MKPGDKPTDRNKAWKLRRRLKEGRTLTSKSQAWLDAYTEATAPGSGAPDPEPNAEPQAVPIPNGPGEHEDVRLEPESVPAPEAPSPPPPPPPPPPRTRATAEDEPEPKRGAAGANWREKYRASGAVDREQTCLMIAGQWGGVLRAMEQQIIAAGGRPWLPVDSLMPSIVLAVDDILPEHISVTPRVAALAGTTAVCVQRWMMRDAIGEAAKAKSEKDAWDAAKVKQYAPLVSVPATPPPPPPPVPAPQVDDVIEWREPERPVF